MTRLLIAAAAVGLLFASGCGSDAGVTLTGSVTVDGQPLKKGLVRLEPDGGQGTPVGGDVKDGRYEVKVKPGKYRIHVDGEPEGTAGMSQAEVMKLSEKELKRRSDDPVPPDAVGNDVEVEVKSGGPQTKDVALKAKGN